MQKLKLAGLSILSGLLMGVSWPETGGLFLLFFVALIPLLFVFAMEEMSKISSPNDE